MSVEGELSAHDAMSTHSAVSASDSDSVSSTTVAPLLSPVVSEPGQSDTAATSAPALLLASYSQILLAKRARAERGRTEGSADASTSHHRGRRRRRGRLIGVGLFSLLCLALFQLVFLPRSSLDRDLRRIRMDKISFAESTRMLLTSISAQDPHADMVAYLASDHSSGQDAPWLLKLFNSLNLNTQLQSFNMETKLPIDSSLTFNGTSVDFLVPPFSADAQELQLDYVHAGEGTNSDYANLNVTHKAVIIKRQHDIGLLIENAQAHGASAIFLYADPADDNHTLHKPFPEGPGRNLTVVNWGVALLPNGTLPSIPVGLLSSADALALPTVSSEPLTLNILMETAQSSMKNVIGSIPGASSEEVVVAVAMDTPNGRGGASNGVTSLAMLARALSELYSLGWQPLRTITLVGYDASAFGPQGYEAIARSHNPNIVSMLHIGGVHGSHLEAKTNPLLGELVDAARTEVPLNTTLHITPPETGCGTPSMYLSFVHTKPDPVEYWGNDLDNIDWVQMVDPGLRGHSTLSQLVARMVISLAENELLPLHTSDYFTTARELIHDLHVPPSHALLKKEVLDLLEESSQLAFAYDKRLAALQAATTEDRPWYFFMDKLRVARAVRHANNILLALDRVFVADGSRGAEHLFWGHVPGSNRSLTQIKRSLKVAKNLINFS